MASHTSQSENASVLSLVKATIQERLMPNYEQTRTSKSTASIRGWCLHYSKEAFM